MSGLRLSTTRQVVAGGLAACALAALNCLWAIGSTSLFDDEAATWDVSAGPIHGLLGRVRASEIAPPLYYGLLHGWIGLTGSQSETTLRLPSVVAAVLMVGAICWLGLLVAGPAAGAGAGLLAAVSPATIIYGQQARAYAPVMLAVVVAVAAFLEARRKRSQRWLVVSCIAAAGGVALHYTAWLVVLPLCLVVARSSAQFSARQRAAYVGLSTLAGLLTVPILISQLQRGRADHQNASLTADNLAAVLGAPFSGRQVEQWPAYVGALIVLVTLLALAVRGRARTAEDGSGHPLLLSAATVAPVVIVVLTLVGVKVLWPRYMAVAVPFLFVAIAAATLGARRRGSRALVCLPLALALFASVRSHRAHFAYYGDIRGAVLTASRSWRATDTVINAIGDPTFDATVRYYAQRFLPPGAVVLASVPRAITDAASVDRRVWAISSPISAGLVARKLPAVRLERSWRYPGPALIQLSLLTPSRQTGRRMP